MRGTHISLEESQLINGFNDAKLIEIPLEHQMAHYNIFTETFVIPYLNEITLLLFFPFFLHLFLYFSNYLLIPSSFNHTFSFSTEYNQ